MARFTTMRRSVFVFAVATLLVLAAGADLAGEYKSCSRRRTARHFFTVSKPCISFITARNNCMPKAEDIPKKCCRMFKKVDVPCICKHLPGFVRKFVSVEKFVFAAQKCSLKKLQPGTKCASYTVPRSEFGV